MTPEKIGRELGPLRAERLMHNTLDWLRKSYAVLPLQAAYDIGQGNLLCLREKLDGDHWGANDMTDTIARYLTEDHRRCDRLLAACEAAMASRSWQAAADAAVALRDAVLHHFALEEEVLFPEVEQLNPAARGPTGVMRMEHQQMRQLLDELAAAVRVRDRENCLGGLETLHMLSQQHNAKEEGILYPLADDALGDRADIMTKRLQAA